VKTLKTFKRLFEPFSDDLKKEKDGFGTFVEWHQYVLRGHREFPEGYSKSISNITNAHGQTWDKKKKAMVDVSTLIVTVRITCNQTGAYQEALGSADAGKTSWGGAVAEAESQAMRRAFANWGLGLEMYLDDNQFDFWTAGSSDDDEMEAEEEHEGVDDEGDEDEDDVTLPWEDDEEGDGSEDSDLHTGDDLPFEDDIPEDKRSTERQNEVLKQIGLGLVHYAEEHSDEDLEEFLEAMRIKLNPGHTKARVGSVIKLFRKKLEELGLDDPTKRDD